MSTINVSNDSFTCRQVDDFAVITVLEGAKLLSTTVSGKEALFEVLNTIKDSPQIKGLAFLYSDEYKGDAEYRQYLKESLEGIQTQVESGYSTVYRFALIQYLEIMNTFPIPIVSGMNGDIGPDSFAVSLAVDLRIVTEGTSFFHPNLEFGLPPSPPLTFYLVRGLGSYRATELILTKPKISSQEALDLGLISEVVPKDDLENRCLDKLRQLSVIPNHTLIETRRMLQPGIDEIREYLDAGFKGSMASLYKLNI